MSSQPRTDTPGGSKSRPRIALPAEAPHASEDALAAGGPSTDDTPTIISRQSITANPSPAGTDGAGVRGRRLAHFELIEPIGVGGMAAVLRARDTQLDRLVALKILPPEMSADEENVRRFHQEARSAAKLDHENIARVFFCGEDQRLHFIAFEFVEGDNLRTLLERRGRIPVREALPYMVQVAAGLAHASHRGVVHRDIKPSNIIITPTGRAKLVDMGLARCLEPRSDNDLTQSGVTLGTFDYISPEQALEPREADVRSDIYSLGCTFYHMLTGRTPVPEGTAAKKLHCHQHVKPPDPRQFVPDLPAEVVLVLDRMMAKQPRDRFQTPEKLVEQLLAAMRRLGIAGEAHGEMLTVETVLPNPPAGRPLVWAGLAAAAVVALVLLLDQAPPARPGAGAKPASPGESGEPGAVSKAGAAAPKAVHESPAPRVAAPADRWAVYNPGEQTVQDLLGWLQEHRDAPRIELHLAGDLDLSQPEGAEAGLVLACREIRIKAAEGGPPPTLRFRYPARADKPVVALTIEARESTVEGVRFVVDGRDAPDEVVSLLLVGGKHTVRRCTFIQAHSSKTRQASVVAQAAKGPSSVKLEHCAFLGFARLSPPRAGEALVLSGAEAGGQDAVVRRGPVHLEAVGCVFGPHTSAFRLEGDLAGDGVVRVEQCSVLLPPRRSAAFEVPAGSAGKLVVEHSLFSRMPGDAEADGSVLLRQADASSAVAWTGRDNGYHDLDAYWVEGSNWQTKAALDFRKSSDRRHDESRVLLFNPWHYPADRQARALEDLDLKRAFRIRTNMAALRQTGRSLSEVVGADTVLGERWLPGSLPPLDEKGEALVPRRLVVDREVDDSSNGHYPNLHQAVGAARPGDTLLIRHNGELPIDPVQLNKKGMSDLTIRPARRFRPVLVLGDATEAETALFRVHDGKLRLEDLQFRLTPRSGLTLGTVVALAGDGDCCLKRCVATLERSGEARLALATLTRPSDGMPMEKMPPSRKRPEGPKLALEGCFIRGGGDLLWTKARRPFALEVRKTLAMLSGGLLNIEAASDGAAADESPRTQVDLRQVTAYLGGPLVRLSTGKDPRGLVPLTIKAAGCLIVPAGGGKTMVSLEGADADDKSPREKLAWEGKQNVFGPFKALLAQLPGGDKMAPLPLTDMNWTEWATEDASSKFKLEPARAPAAETRFAVMSPDQLAPPRDEADAGAPLVALPRPAPDPDARD
jgi:hypothetical protein